MRNPLDFLPAPYRKPLFLALLLLTLGLAAIFQPLNAPLQTPEAPFGIISLQLAWTPDKAQSMLDSWDAPARLYAAYGLGYDYLFMVSYALTLALAALLAADRRIIHAGRYSPGWVARIGPWIAYGVFLAAAWDAAENIGQTQQLFNGQVELAAFIGVCATVKFALLLLGLGYGLVGWLWPKRK